ncbi:putative short-chain dehydrogenase/reductase [Xylariales sp. AK1849]|nr:putative short-chain dehydrogenase/reductase [Xylariales sp. AK1849]
MGHKKRLPILQARKGTRSAIMVETRKRTVLVTGCSEGGIGFALAQEFHRRGLRVFATARNLSKVQHLQDAGLEIVQLDVVDQASIRSAAETVSKRTGGTLDILVNNAGAGYQIPLLDADLDEAKKVFDVNIWGLLATTQTFAPLLAANAAEGSQARVVNVGSVASLIPVPWQGVYNATKGALSVLNDNMRLELRPLGIEVLHIVTGGIATRFYANASGQKLPETSLYTPVAAEIEKDLAGYVASAAQTMSVETYARRVVDNTLSQRPNVNMWVGGSSFSSWVLHYFAWPWMLDLFLERLFNMGSLGKKFKGQRGKKD